MDKPHFMDKPHYVAIRRAERLTVYEGLPHQRFENELLHTELATKQTITIGDFPFYEAPLTVTSEEVEILRALCGEWRNYGRIQGAKYCGGFHPDYAMTWHDGSTDYHCLICFGCGEMLFVGPKLGFSIDIRALDNPAYPQDLFAATLKKYRVQRPERDTGMSR